MVGFEEGEKNRVDEQSRRPNAHTSIDFLRNLKELSKSWRYRRFFGVVRELAGTHGKWMTEEKGFLEA